MIVVKVQGGLGNQLFQYAIGLVLAVKNGTTLKLHLPPEMETEAGQFKKLLYRILQSSPLKTTWMKEILYFSKYSRTYQLDKLGITKEILVNDKEIEKLFIGSVFNVVKEIEFSFNADILSLTGNIYLDGFWQSEKYFNLNKQLVVNSLKLAESIINPLRQKILNTNAVAVHIRRGDYQFMDNKNSFGILDLEYYQIAMDLMNQKLKNPHFYIFSDAEDWVKQNFLNKMNFENVELIQGQKSENSYIDLINISLCKHFILANSSFSWWGAWLSKHSEKIVIVPERPFIGQLFGNCEDYYPDNWIRIKSGFQK